MTGNQHHGIFAFHSLLSIVTVLLVSIHRTDAAPPLLVKDLRQAADLGGAQSHLIGSSLQLGNGLVLFVADGPAGAELWATDGTPDGTRLLQDIFPGSTGSGLHDFILFGGLAYFGADDGTNGDELWVSDGTPKGTRMLADIHPGPGGSKVSMVNGSMSGFYFVADDGVHGRELWRSDGTSNGTILVNDIAPGRVPVI